MRLHIFSLYVDFDSDYQLFQNAKVYWDVMETIMWTDTPQAPSGMVWGTFLGHSKAMTKALNPLRLWLIVDIYILKQRMRSERQTRKNSKRNCR